MQVKLNFFSSYITNFLIKILTDRKQSKKQPKSHDYTQYDCDRDYIFEFVERENCAYMTGQGKSINKGDYLILSSGSNTIRYQVKEIEYYSNPPDMWIALIN